MIKFRCFLFFVFLCPAPFFAAAQALDPEVEELVQEGIYYHDEGDYETAVEYYRKALEIDSEAPLIYYEMGFSYLYDDKPAEALETVIKGIEKARNRGDTDILPALLDLKGSALDNLERREEAVEAFKEGLRYGAEHTLLYYNLALAYYHMGRLDDARDAASSGVWANPFHPSGNFILGKVCFEQNRRTQSLLSLCYFLLLEPHTERSGEAVEIIGQILDNSAEAAGGMDRILFHPEEFGGKPFPGEASSPRDLFQEQLTFIFTTLGEMADILPGDEGDLWLEYYTPFFSRLAGSGYMETFCRYITLSYDLFSKEWLEENSDKVNEFFDWLNSGE